MCFKINMGCLYGIIYYYSVLDILLGDIWNYSEGLTIVSKVLFTLIRLNPAFLGKLCFVKGISGIDQYTMYYTHPTAIAILLILLAVSARFSRRFAVFISKGIIRVICLILTLTYSSIASTSLLILRPIRFTGIPNSYCYLSPDIRYFTGRHIIYGTIASIYELLIVSGLPILLLLEPFINHKINFTRIKPLLDQFQGCYKDKYRWFASVYLLCRQVILIIVIIEFLDDYIALYLLIGICLMITLLHYMVQPYKINILNNCDGFFLLLLIMVSSLQMIVLSESIVFTNAVIIGIAYALTLFPVVVCVFLLVYIQRRFLVHFIKCFKHKVTKFLQMKFHFTKDVHARSPSPLPNCPLCNSITVSTR